MSDDYDEGGDIPDMGDSQVGSSEGDSGSRRGGLPIFRIVLVVLGIVVLVLLFPSFRYAIQGGSPQDLGVAGSTELSDDLHNAYVTVTGTANTEQVAQPQGVGYEYMALNESGGRLWVAVPLGEEAPAEGFAGRFMRFSKVDEYRQVSEFLKDSVDTITIDVPIDEFVAALGGDTSKFVPGPDDVAVIATAEQDVDIQFGKEGFTAAEAEEILKGFGYPFVAGKSGKMRQFVARIPGDKREEVKKELRAHLPEGVSPAHPRKGATYLVRTETYKAPVGDVKADNGQLSFPFKEGGKAERGYNLENGALVERRVDGARLFVAVGDINRIRIERPLSIPDDAYVVYVGKTPGSQLPFAILWILVLLGIIAIPVVPLVKQAAKPKAQAVEDVVE